MTIVIDMLKTVVAALGMLTERSQAKFAGYTTKLEHQQILNALRPGHEN